MKVAIMQPYWLPYRGYFQLMNHVDLFVVYDHVQYTKKGWINRNRLLSAAGPSTISIPVSRGSTGDLVSEKQIADEWILHRERIMSRIDSSYHTAPSFDRCREVVNEILHYQTSNLFEFIFASLRTIASHLEISTPIVVSSSVESNRHLKGEERVLGICKDVGATEYVNAIGGVALYNPAHFRREGMTLHFLKSSEVPYTQGGECFVPYLSIVDLMMNTLQVDWHTHIATGYGVVRGEETEGSPN